MPAPKAVVAERPPFLRGQRAPRSLRELRLLDVVVVSAPFALLLLYMLAGAISQVSYFRQFPAFFTSRLTLERALEQRIEGLIRAPALAVRQLDLDPNARDAAVLHLLADPTTFERFQYGPIEQATADWIDVEIERGGAVHAAKLRLRGDTAVHWATPKRSFTLKLPRRTELGLPVRFAFSGKTPIEQQLSASLAGSFGLMAPESRLAPVFVNRRFYGLFRRVEVPDESLLRRLQRMPGSIHRGDTILSESFRNIPINLFRNPYIWDRTAEVNSPLATPRDDLAGFLRALNDTTYEGHRRLLRLVDPGELARLVAYLLSVGDPYHLTNYHNQLWYQDPSSGLFHPIPWDVRVASLASPPEGFPFNTALVRLLREPELLPSALEYVARNEPTLRAALAREAREIDTRFAQYLEFDALRGDSIPEVVPPQAAREMIEANLSLLLEWGREVRVESALTPRGEGAFLADVVVRGRAAASLTGIRADCALRLRADVDLDGAPSAGDRELALHPGDAPGQLLLESPLRLLPGIVPNERKLDPGALAYRFFVESDGSCSAPPELELARAQGGAPLAAAPLAAGTQLPAGSSFHPWMAWQRRSEPRVIELRGDVHLREDLRVAQGDTLAVAAGSVLRLDPEVSIVSRGRVELRGTQAEPIVIEPAEADRPWGALILQGAGASGSRLRHALIRGGGGAARDGVSYKGMVDVHWAEDVRFEHTTFADNRRSDDSLNAVHAQIDVIDSRFERANGDALDFDYSRGRVCGSVFADSVNDAVDLMTSQVALIGNTMLRSGDKGISVGEGSEPFALGNRLVGGKTGSEVKDGSRPFFAANELRANRTALLARAKNWRYGSSGWPRVAANLWVENGAGIVHPDASHLTEVAPGTDFAALLASYGVVRASDGSFRAAPPRPPLERMRFIADFESAADGWRAGPNIERLRKTRGHLEARLAGGSAWLERAVQWDLAKPGLVLVEIGADRGTELSVRVEGEAQAAGVDWKAPAPAADWQEERSFQLFALPLAPGHYRRVAISSAAPRGRRTIRLAEISVWELPAPTKGSGDGLRCVLPANAAALLGERP